VRNTSGYVRDSNGCIRRRVPKIKGKAAVKRAKRLRQREEFGMDYRRKP